MSYNELTVVKDTASDLRITDGTYTLDDVNEQVEWNAGWTVGRPAGMSAVDEDAPWIFWWDLRSETVGLGDDYINSYFLKLGQNAPDVSRPIETLLNPYVASQARYGAYLASGDYTLDELNEYLYYRDAESYHRRMWFVYLVEDLERYNEYISQGKYSLVVLNEYIYLRKAYHSFLDLGEAQPRLAPWRR